MANPVNPFWEQQQQLIKMWNENMSKIPGMEAYTEMYKNMLPNGAEYWDKFMEMVPNASDYWNNLTKAMPNPNTVWQNFANMMPNAGTFANMMPFKIPGMDTYAKVFDLWKGMSDPASFLQNFQSTYTDLAQELFKNFLPEGSLPFLQKPQQLLDTCVAFYQQFLSPWMKIDEDLMRRVSAGDTQAYREFFKEFHRKYEDTFDKLFNMMGMGLNREANEDQMKAISAYIKMLFITGEMVIVVMNAIQESMKALVERYQSDLSEGKVVTTFREFYHLWYEVTEESLLKLFNTDDFAKTFGDFADKYAQYMVAMNREYERMLAALPIPTNTDMKSLYKTVYDLRKDVRDLHRELDALKAQKPAKQ